jgi:hypothetical protein
MPRYPLVENGSRLPVALHKPVADAVDWNAPAFVDA